MMPMMGLSWLGDLVVGIVIIAAGAAWHDFRKQHKRKWKQQDLMAMQIEAIVYGLSSVNHGIGEAFQPHYEARLQQLKDNRNFIDDV